MELVCLFYDQGVTRESEWSEQQKKGQQSEL